MGNTYLTGFIPWRLVGQKGKKKNSRVATQSLSQNVGVHGASPGMVSVCVSRAHDGIQEHTDIYHNTAACDPFRDTDATHQPQPPYFGCVSG